MRDTTRCRKGQSLGGMSRSVLLLGHSGLPRVSMVFQGSSAQAYLSCSTLRIVQQIVLRRCSPNLKCGQGANRCWTLGSGERKLRTHGQCNRWRRVCSRVRTDPGPATWAAHILFPHHKMWVVIVLSHGIVWVVMRNPGRALSLMPGLGKFLECVAFLSLCWSLALLDMWSCLFIHSFTRSAHRLWVCALCCQLCANEMRRQTQLLLPRSSGWRGGGWEARPLGLSPAGPVRWELC